MTTIRQRLRKRRNLLKRFNNCRMNNKAYLRYDVQNKTERRLRKPRGRIRRALDRIFFNI